MSQVFRRKKAFTLVELLVVIGIIAVLISVLLPALSRARESAKKIACASNVRQLTLITLMYANDNRGVLPSQGASTGIGGMIVGEFAKEPVLEFLRRYLRVPDASATTSWSSLTLADPSLHRVASNIRFDAGNRAPLRCPSANTPLNQTRLSYAYYTGSCIPLAPAADGNTYPYYMKLTKLTSAAMKTSRASTGGQNFGAIGQSPALWGDRCNIASGGNNGGVIETNHWDAKKNAPAGGNVGNADGSVIWMPYSMDTVASNVFVQPSGAMMSASILVPSNAIQVFMDNKGNVLQQGGNANRVLMGRSFQSLSKF